MSEKKEIRVVLSDPEDITLWERIKQYLCVKADSEAFRATIRKFAKLIEK